LGKPETTRNRPTLTRSDDFALRRDWRGSGGALASFAAFARFAIAIFGMGRSQPTGAAAISDGTGAESSHNQSRAGYERRRVGSDRAMIENHPSCNLSLKGVFFGSLELNKEEMDIQITTNR
jgi:hypothetical protein